MCIAVIINIGNRSNKYRSFSNLYLNHYGLSSRFDKGVDKRAKKETPNQNDTLHFTQKKQATDFKQAADHIRTMNLPVFSSRSGAFSG